MHKNAYHESIKFLKITFLDNLKQSHIINKICVEAQHRLIVKKQFYRVLKIMSTAVYCPHCKVRAKVRSSVVLSDLLSELYCECRNAQCRCRFVAHLEPAYLLFPSAIPDPEIQLPISSRALARQQKKTKSEKQISPLSQSE